MTDTRSLIDTERARLVSVLQELDAAAWTTPSSCTGWTVRDVATHLLMPYELAVPRLLVGLARARFDFDRFARRRAVSDRRSATDAEWAHGDGSPVAGTTSALVTTLTGRSAALDELSGPGVADLRRRLSSAG